MRECFALSKTGSSFVADAINYGRPAKFNTKPQKSQPRQGVWSVRAAASVLQPRTYSNASITDCCSSLRSVSLRPPVERTRAEASRRA